MKKLTIGLVAVVACCVATKAFAAPVIAGGKHDFTNGSGYVGNGGTYLAPNKCTTCHGAHKVKQNKPLWNRDAPSGTGWTMYDGATPDASFLSNPSGMCLSCHDGQTAIGKDGANDVKMATAYRGNWGRNLSDSHPVGKVIAWNAGSIKAQNTVNGLQDGIAGTENGTVGCTSCHSMHKYDETNGKNLRTGDTCTACHSR
ncbi:MAG: hypothetical protein HY927_00390 [Elusimicrobia bacterium]|nr:hypothetical protein [Elusimicrobiota bacterium]